MEPQRGKVYSHNHSPHGFDPCNGPQWRGKDIKRKELTPSLLCCNDYPLRAFCVDTPKCIWQAVLMGKPAGGGWVVIASEASGFTCHSILMYETP
jgi:hypothetical protein